ncbi:hypothetical protein INT44_001154 [Umbelopsis vinacea]|uniref:Uncharacterized protein n=1 Tax=Umbelopsis vinacea TaxID=44442 RepID=A0A8H7QBM4_9FUNG|nr:hypothetical protein INT44_001154 [Umbelopsis vinacea]KAI9289307.1 hypothetical protein BC943DRAFT_70476 [Umbelopsis sp. AD052]
MTELTDRKSAPLPKGCELLEVLQYQCEIGTAQVICNPFVRVFARCQGSPLYEVTPVDHADDPLYSRLEHASGKKVVEDLKTPPGVVAAESEKP